MGRESSAVLDYLNEGLDARTQYRFYVDRGILAVSFYVGASRKQRSTSVAAPEVVDASFRGEVRTRAQEIVSASQVGRVLSATAEDRVRVASTLSELRDAWIKIIREQYPASWKARYYQINNVVAFFEKDLDGVLTPLQQLVADEGPQLFVNARMRQRDKNTVKHEVGAMFQLLDWCKLKHYIATIPPRPAYRPKDYGTRVGPQRAQPVRLRDEVALKIIEQLPEYAGRGSFGRDDGSLRGAFVCRDWMRFAFETGLRPSTVARLRAGVHWKPGWDHVRVDSNIDKGRNAKQKGKPRNVILTNVARKILEKHAPEVGLIFGRHDIRTQWKRAAIAVLGEDLGSQCAPYDLRHGANFRMRSTVGGTLGGAMHQMGHSLATTNDGYLDGDEEEARETVALLNKRNAELARSVRKTVRKSSGRPR